jgi:5'-3' exonuclease
MGVPGFFAWLLKNNTHKNIILNNLDNINNLYFDANCLFHPKCFDILKLHSHITDIDKLEKLMIKRIIEYITFIINYVGPSDFVYIAVDGVAPIAKINQQRKRRYKSVIDKEYQTLINEKYKIIKNDIWSNIVITPGTDFMIRLDNEIINFINTLQKNNKKLKIIYSSYKECGEGEHKIMRHIKNNLTNKNHVIYGLDADLIFLAMSYEKSENIFLLRELNHIKNISQPITEEVNEKLCFVSIKNTIDTYNKIIKSKLEENLDIMEINLEDYDFSKDFIILCFMLGNDFIPHIPSLNIRNNGIEHLIDAYVYMFTFTKSYLISKLNNSNSSQLNNSSLLLILSYLKDIESEYFEIDLPKYKQKFRHKKFMKSANSTNEDYEREIWEHENMINNKSDEDYIKLGFDNKSEYKFRYYEHHFHSRINQQKFINKICHNYLMMMQWIYKYYFEIEMPSWRYCYQYDESPFISDLYIYLNEFLSEGKQFESILYEDPIKIETQLLSVIPPQFYKNIFNKNIENEYKKKLNDNRTKYMFPQKPHIELNKDMYWMCEPLLPTIDINLLNN